MANSNFQGFGLRLFSGVVLAAGALAAILAGGIWFAGLIALGVLAMTREWPELCLAGGGLRPLWWPRPPLAAVGFVVLAVIALGLLLAGHLRAALALSISGALVVALFGQGGARDRLLLGLGLPYIFFTATALIWLSGDPRGGLSIIWLLVVVAMSDIGGYVAGKSIGGPRLAPRISPNKTWAGFVGGTALAAGAGAAFVFLEPGASVRHLGLTALAISIAAQLGDLLESAIKRHFAVKDSGSIIPGHGGVFDRFDGLLVAAPVLAALAAANGDLGFLWR